MANLNVMAQRETEGRFKEEGQPKTLGTLQQGTDQEFTEIGEDLGQLVGGCLCSRPLAVSSKYIRDLQSHCQSLFGIRTNPWIWP